jgi:ABC-2 type transport system ATP-binding protein
VAEIQVEQLSKTYKVHAREAGVGAALRSLVVRRYRYVKAVEELSFNIGAGQRVGFLGPNGAGKTTTLKMLAGLLHPTSGRVTVGGYVPSQKREGFLKSIMLVMGQKQQLLWDLPPSETFELNRAIYGVPRDAFRKTVAQLDELLELGDLIHRPTRQLSLGERMRCELAAALIHSPKLLFLDEPTIGLDITMQAKVRAFIKAYNERTGATVLLTSHYMDDVAALCPRVVVINHGSLVYDGALDALVRRVRPEKRMVLQLRENVPVESAAVMHSLGTLVSSEGLVYTFQVPQDRIAQAVGVAMQALPVQDVTIENPPLEEVMGELFSMRSTSGTPGSVVVDSAGDRDHAVAS